jgi:putative FmdB family regulatory protein
MPPDEYRCPDCEQTFEMVVPPEGAGIVQACPRCRTTNTQPVPPSVTLISGAESCGNDEDG